MGSNRSASLVLAVDDVGDVRRVFAQGHLFGRPAPVAPVEA